MDSNLFDSQLQKKRKAARGRLLTVALLLSALDRLYAEEEEENSCCSNPECTECAATVPVDNSAGSTSCFVEERLVEKTEAVQRVNGVVDESKVEAADNRKNNSRSTMAQLQPDKPGYYGSASSSRQAHKTQQGSESVFLFSANQLSASPALVPCTALPRSSSSSYANVDKSIRSTSGQTAQFEPPAKAPGGVASNEDTVEDPTSIHSSQLQQFSVHGIAAERFLIDKGTHQGNRPYYCRHKNNKGKKWAKFKNIVGIASCSGAAGDAERNDNQIVLGSRSQRSRNDDVWLLNEEYLSERDSDSGLITGSEDSVELFGIGLRSKLENGLRISTV